MNTNTKNNAMRNAGSRASWAKIEQADTGKAARIERWRTIATRLFNEVKAYHTKALDVLAYAANMSPVEYVIEYMSEKRGMNGGGVNEFHKRTKDVENETMSTRSRNLEEKMAVREAYMDVAIGDYDHFTKEELLTLAQRFMRKGEWTFGAAIIRAAKSGIAWERDADTNAAK